MVGTPVAAYIGPPRGLTKHVSTLGIFSKCLVENKIAPGAPFSCQTACLYPGECGGMSCATSRPGPGRFSTCYLRVPAAFLAHNGSNTALEYRSRIPFSCQTACLYHGECGGMSCATSRPGPGPGRAGFQLYTFALPLPSWLITGRIPLSPRRNSADSTAGSHASTWVGHTCGWDPRSVIYRAATGPH